MWSASDPIIGATTELHIQQERPGERNDLNLDKTMEDRRGNHYGWHRQGGPAFFKSFKEFGEHCPSGKT